MTPDLILAGASFLGAIFAAVATLAYDHDRRGQAYRRRVWIAQGYDMPRD